MNDDSTVPIVRRPLPLASKSMQILSSQNAGSCGRTFSKLKFSKRFALPPTSQTWVMVMTQHHGLILIQPLSQMYERDGRTAAKGVAQVRSDQPFRLLIKNSTNNPVKLHEKRMVAMLLIHSTVLIPKQISLSEFLSFSLPGEIQPRHVVILDQISIPKRREEANVPPINDELDL